MQRNAEKGWVMEKEDTICNWLTYQMHCQPISCIEQRRAYARGVAVRVRTIHFSSKIYQLARDAQCNTALRLGQCACIALYIGF